MQIFQNIKSASQSHIRTDLKGTLSAFIKVYAGYTQKNGAENWFLPQMNTNYDDYILQLDGMYTLYMYVYVYNKKLTPWSRVLLEKLTSKLCS